MNTILYEELKNLARTQKLAAYSDISPLLGLSMDREDHRDEIATLLSEIAIHEHKSGHPMLTALIVHKGEDNNPGEGFFTIAQELGVFNGTRSSIPRLIFWVNQVKAVHGHWQTT